MPSPRSDCLTVRSGQRPFRVAADDNDAWVGKMIRPFRGAQADGVFHQQGGGHIICGRAIREEARLRALPAVQAEDEKILVSAS